MLPAITPAKLTSHETSIIQALKKAMKTSCDDALTFSADETEHLGAEYLLTVNAAKEIAGLNTTHADPYKIAIEHSTKKFATYCTPVMAKQAANNCIGHRTVLRTANNTTRGGRIDIAVYLTGGSFDDPLCAIEVKSFNPTKTSVMDDLARNAEYFSVSSPTGDSTLPFAVFIALESYRGVWSDANEASNIDKLKARYEGYIQSDAKLSSLDQKVDVFTIRRGTLPDPADPHILQHGLNGDEDYHFLGVIVTTKK